MNHLCRVVCNAIGRSECGFCIAFVLGILVTTPDVHGRGRGRGYYKGGGA